MPPVQNEVVFLVQRCFSSCATLLFFPRGIAFSLTLHCFSFRAALLFFPRSIAFLSALRDSLYCVEFLNYSQHKVVRFVQIKVKTNSEKFFLNHPESVVIFVREFKFREFNFRSSTFASSTFASSTFASSTFANLSQQGCAGRGGDGDVDG